MTRSETAKVNRYLDKLDYPLRAEMNAVRLILLGADKKIEEHIIKWGAPSFYYKGCMATFSTSSRKSLTLIFHNGAILNDTTGLLEGDHKFKRTVKFGGMNDVKIREVNLKKVISEWIELMDK